uniref:Uncharacterized protein n=1 Tax=Acinetobacter lwoffii TaxID=28090 RepID=A0A385L115_ACILW
MVRHDTNRYLRLDHGCQKPDEQGALVALFVCLDGFIVITTLQR